MGICLKGKKKDELFSSVRLSRSDDDGKNGDVVADDDDGHIDSTPFLTSFPRKVEGYKKEEKKLGKKLM